MAGSSQEAWPGRKRCQARRAAFDDPDDPDVKRQARSAAHDDPDDPDVKRQARSAAHDDPNVKVRFAAPSAPRDFEDLVDLRRLLRDLEDGSPQWWSRFQAWLRQGVTITTSYSGCGCAESVLPMIAGADGKVEAFSACDNDELCRRVLKEHRAGSRPQHIFGDILEVGKDESPPRLCEPPHKP